VFGESFFPRAARCRSDFSSKACRQLKESGVAARKVSATELEAASFLENAASTVLVLPSGNAFPKGAFPNLQEYHKRGGSLFDGNPIYPPCERENGKWRDLGHQNFYEHGEKGMGTGGFLSAPVDQKWTIQIPASPLGLPNWFSEKEGRTQWLDTRTFGSNG